MLGRCIACMSCSRSYNALHSTICADLTEYQQRAALALFIAHGRNPANLSWLRESDLINVAPGLNEPCWVIRYPRIKKQLLNPRDDFVEVQLPNEFAPYIQELIAANRLVEPANWMGSIQQILIGRCFSMPMLMLRLRRRAIAMPFLTIRLDILQRYFKGLFSGIALLLL